MKLKAKAKEINVVERVGGEFVPLVAGEVVVQCPSGFVGSSSSLRADVGRRGRERTDDALPAAHPLVPNEVVVFSLSSLFNLFDLVVAHLSLLVEFHSEGYSMRLFGQFASHLCHRSTVEHGSDGRQ